MNINEYLKLCQKCAIFPKGVGGVINNIPDDLVVVYEDCKYFPLKCELFFDKNGNPIYTAILHDLKSNSIQYSNLENIRRVEQ